MIITSILIVVLCLCIIANVAMMIREANHIKEIKAKAKETEALAQDLESHADQVINKYKHHADEMRSENARLQSLLAKQDERCKDTLEKINALEEYRKSAKEKIEKQAKIIGDMRKENVAYKEQIATPTKGYILTHLFRLYSVKNTTALAEVLGVSKSAINNRLKDERKRNEN